MSYIWVDDGVERQYLITARRGGVVAASVNEGKSDERSIVDSCCGRDARGPRNHGQKRPESLTRIFPRAHARSYNRARSQSIRDLRGSNPPFTFVGVDGRTSTTPPASDDSAAPFLDLSMSQRIPPYGFPRTDGVSNVKIFDYYQANPTHFLLCTNNSSVSRSQRQSRGGSQTLAALCACALRAGEFPL